MGSHFSDNVCNTPGTIADAVKNAIEHNHVIPVDILEATSSNGTSSASNFTISAMQTSTIQEQTPQWYEMEFRALQYALFICCFFQTIGGFIFLVMSWYVLEDKEIADRAIQQV